MAASAFETGHSFFAVCAIRSKVAASMPGTWPSVSRDIRVIAKPPATGPKSTLALVWTRVGGWPCCDSAADSAPSRNRQRGRRRSAPGRLRPAHSRTALIVADAVRLFDEELKRFQ
jgi:hypothetical protein